MSNNETINVYKRLCSLSTSFNLLISVQFSLSSNSTISQSNRQFVASKRNLASLSDTPDYSSEFFEDEDEVKSKKLYHTSEFQGCNNEMKIPPPLFLATSELVSHTHFQPNDLSEASKFSKITTKMKRNSLELQNENGIHNNIADEVKFENSEGLEVELMPRREREFVAKISTPRHQNPERALGPKLKSINIVSATQNVERMLGHSFNSSVSEPKQEGSNSMTDFIPGSDRITFLAMLSEIVRKNVGEIVGNNDISEVGSKGIRWRWLKKGEVDSNSMLNDNGGERDDTDCIEPVSGSWGLVATEVTGSGSSCTYTHYYFVECKSMLPTIRLTREKAMRERMQLQINDLQQNVQSLTTQNKSLADKCFVMKNRMSELSHLSKTISDTPILLVWKVSISNGLVKYVSTKASESMLRYSPGALLNQSFLDTVHNDDIEAAQCLLQKPCRKRIRRYNRYGQVIWLESTSQFAHCEREASADPKKNNDSTMIIMEYDISHYMQSGAGMNSFGFMSMSGASALGKENAGGS